MKASIHKFMATLAAVGLPWAAFAQESATKVAERAPQGQHFGLSDEVWLWIFMGTAVVFTMIILTINTAIRNLAETKSLWRPKEAATLVFLLVGSTVFAQETAPEEARFILSDSAFWALAAANFFLMFYALLQLRLLRNVTRKISGLDALEVEESPLVETETLLAKLWKRINDHKEVEHEKDILLNHNYDGIMELDNNLPPWWKWTFYLSIVFGVIYMTHYHITKTGDLPHAELQAKLKQADEEVAAYLARASMNVDESSVKYVLDDERLKGGASIYKASCAVCHGDQGQGGVGPNLTDPYWLHGGSIGDVFKTVKYGVPAKGMKPWEKDLSPIQIQNVSTYILAMQGNTPPNPKEPQGDFVEPVKPEGAEGEEGEIEEQEVESESPEQEEPLPENAQAQAL